MRMKALITAWVLFSIQSAHGYDAVVSSLLDGLPIEIQKESPKFSFNGAKAAFKAAKTPVATDITGEWMVVGAAFNPEMTINGTDGYWPDGRMELPSWGKGYFRVVAWIEAVDDAFGKTTLTLNHKLIGLETGKVYSRGGPFTGSITESFEYDNPGSKSVCGSTSRCKIVEATGMLLCEQTGNDSRPECYSGSIYTYDGFMRIPPPEKK